MLAVAALWSVLASASVRATELAPTEQQLKAVFVFNFAHFVAWPPESFASAAEPFVIGVLGSDSLAAQVEAAVRDERVDTHALEVRRFHSVEEVGDCRILYIDRSYGSDLGRLLGLLADRRTLTVSDVDGAARRGVMIQLATEQNRIRLLINAESARSAGLTVSSNLLRLAKVARTGD
jgi:hypothetical protein